MFDTLDSFSNPPELERPHPKLESFLHSFRVLMGVGWMAGLASLVSVLNPAACWGGCQTSVSDILAGTCVTCRLCGTLLETEQIAKRLISLVGSYISFWPASNMTAQAQCGVVGATAF